MILRREVARYACLVEQSGIRGRINKLRGDGTGVIRYLAFGVDVYLSFLTVFGGDENNAVGTLRAIDGRCRSVFQNRETLDVFNVQVVDVRPFETVY